MPVRNCLPGLFAFFLHAFHEIRLVETQDFAALDENLPVHENRVDVPGVAGGTILGDGRVGLILDLAGVIANKAE